MPTRRTNAETIKFMRSNTSFYFNRQVHFFLDFFLNRSNYGKTMKEYDGGRDYTQEFWKAAITSQIAMLDTMANALGSLPQDMQGNWVRDMYKTNAHIFSLYFRTLEQAGAQSVEIQVSALRQSSDTLKAVLSRMEQGSKPPEPEVKTF